MSIIQTIRDKAAWVLIGAIALALIAFILQDAFSSNSRFMGPTDIGEVNGTKISAADFEQRYSQTEAQYRNMGYPLNDVLRQDIRQSIWDGFIQDIVFKEKFEDLGITVTNEELSDILYGENPPADLRQQFTDPNTGVYDASAAYEAILALSKDKNNPSYNGFFNQYLPSLKEFRKQEKYLSLISNSAYVPSWYVQKLAQESSLSANISYVMVPYHTISDSAVTVTDSEIINFIKKFPEDYKQDEARGIEYVMFDASASAEDTANVVNKLNSLKEEFQNDEDVAAFLLRNGSETEFFDGYIQGSKILHPAAESVKGLQENEVFGPYFDQGSVVMAKMLSKRSIPDTVKVRHILIKTAEQGMSLRDDSTASKLMDSIVNAIKGGASFASMVEKYSEDPGSKSTNGEYEFTSIQFGNLSKEFAEVAFYGRTGDKKVVKVTNASYSGYHYIEVMNQKGFETGFKVAYLSLPILPSDQTINNALSKASEFAAEAKDKASFDAAAEKHGYNKFNAFDIKPLDSYVLGLGSSRELVKWVYNAKRGQVAAQPIEVEDKFVVPVLTRIIPEGLLPADIARPLVEPTIRNMKKAEQIKKNLGSFSSLEQVAQATGQPVQTADTITFNSTFIPNVGQEVAVVGAAFNDEYKSKPSPAITGNSGVFVIQTNNVIALPNPSFDPIGQQASMLSYQERALSDPRLVLEILKKGAKIKDNRREFY